MPVKYRGTTTQHPWVVTVLARGPTYVQIRVVQGPGKSRGKVFRLGKAIFGRLYKPITKG